MTARNTQVVVIPLDGSMLGAIAEVADALSLPLKQWHRGSGERMPRGVALLVAGGNGRERDALDLLDDLPSTRIPTFVVGTAADRRVAVAAVHRGAEDYFALPRTRISCGAPSNAASIAPRRRRPRRPLRPWSGRPPGSARSWPGPALTTMLEHAARVAIRRDVTVLIGARPAPARNWWRGPSTNTVRARSGRS